MFSKEKVDERIDRSDHATGTVRALTAVIPDGRIWIGNGDFKSRGRLVAHVGGAHEARVEKVFAIGRDAG